MKTIDYSASKLKIFAHYIARHKGLFMLDMFCALIVAVIELAFPYISRLALNSYLPQRLYRAFFLAMAAVVAAYIIKTLIYYIIIVIGHRMGVLTESEMRKDIFEHMQELSFTFFDNNRTGALMSRITTDLFTVTELAHHGPENILICGLTILGSMGIMFTVEWRLTLVLAILFTLCFGFTLSQRKRMKTANIEVKKKTADIYSAIESSISGVRTAKAFANEDVENDKFEQANKLFRGAKVEFYRAMGMYQTGMEFTTSIMHVAVVIVGGLLIVRGRMDFVDLLTFTLYVSAFVTPVRKLAQFVELYMDGTAGFERFLEIMRTEPEIRDAPDAKKLERPEGRIDFENVSFSYDNGIPVLSDINLHISPGECLALVGPSGGGKTTLCQLLPRFYEVTEGSVKIDGQDVRGLTQLSLRQNIGIIQQDVFMFAGTIKENIRYGRPEASDAEVVEAAVKAEIHSEIMAMPDGYDSYIGERGVMLSGGQKQRISIARVFLKDPGILILDEATSALDTVTEQYIQTALNELSVGRTSIVVAHRLSTVKKRGQNSGNRGRADSGTWYSRGTAGKRRKIRGTLEGAERGGK